MNKANKIGWHRVSLPAASWVSTALSQTYPVKPVRLLFGYTAGGAGDVSARILAQKLSELLGQQVVVENRPGAGGAIADEAVARAPPRYCRHCAPNYRMTWHAILRRCRWW